MIEISEQAKKRADEVMGQCIIHPESVDAFHRMRDNFARFIQETSDVAKEALIELPTYGLLADLRARVQSLILPDDEPDLRQEILIWLGMWRDNVPPEAVERLQNIADNVGQLIVKAGP